MTTKNIHNHTGKMPRSIRRTKSAKAYPESVQEVFSTHTGLHTDSTSIIKTTSLVANKGWKPFFSFLIDTVRLRLETQHLPLAEYARGNPNVKVNGNKFTLHCPQSLASVHLFSHQNNTVLFLEFSIPKLLTGQNVIGHLDLHRGCLDGIRKAFNLLNFQPTLAEWMDIQQGKYKLNRVDITVHVDCGTASNANALMVALRHFIVTHSADISMFGYETLYIGKSSERRTLKIYLKGIELGLKRRSIPTHVHGSKYLTRRAQSLVRFELTLRRLELAKHENVVNGVRYKLSSPLAWDEQLAQSLIEPWIQAMQNAGGMVPNVQRMSQLSHPMQAKLNAWLMGDLSAFHHGVTPATYRKGRRLVKDATGIDIANGLTPALQATCIQTSRDLIQRGLGYRTYPKNWIKAVNAVSSYQPPAPVTKSILRG